MLLGTAYLAGLISSQLYLPPLVGYLAAGYVLHAAGVHADATLAHLSGIGIQLLLFTVNLKLKPSSLVKREVLSVGGWHLLIVTAVSVAIFSVCMGNFPAAW